MTIAPLDVQNVSKRFGAKVALDDVSLALREGEIFGLIGLNGAGKTTLIKIILNLMLADSGAVQLFGRPPSAVAARAQLSYLPEKFQPSRYLKGREHLALALSAYGKPYEEFIAQHQALALDLDPLMLQARVGGYSKGMGQKLGLIGALLVDAPLLVLDEPMSGLDPSARIKLKDQLLALKPRNKTVFFSSHILSDIDEICDRIGVLHQGKLVYIGAPAEFKGTYREASLEKAFLRSIAA